MRGRGTLPQKRNNEIATLSPQANQLSFGGGERERKNGYRATEERE